MSEPVLQIEQAEGIATLTLNRPRALNALSSELRDRIARAFEALQGDASLGVVILTGSGRAFSAGVDLKEMGAREGTGSEVRIDDGGLMRALASFDRPIIGAINGFAITGGFELALMCDILIASSEAKFADTHARVGLLPGWGLSQRLPRLIGSARAKELSLTGNYLSAEQAERWGLVNRVVAPEALLPTCRELARDILGCQQGAVRGIKRLIDEGLSGSFSEGMALEAKTSRDWLKSVRTDDVAARRSSVQSRGRDQSR